jgi:type III pantothenate kinase
MAQLVIDIGNTLIKAAIFDGYELVEVQYYDEVTHVELQVLLSKYPVKRAIISTVRGAAETWFGILEQQVKVLLFNRSMAQGIQNHYSTPQTLGLDRLAGVLGARHLFSADDNLVIDAGTCITYDGIDAQANYYGGSISPGLNMRYKALQHYTAILPLVEADPDFSGYYGDNTINAIRSGVQNGLLYEIEGFIESYQKKARHLNIILTGGDSVFLDTVLKNSIFAGYIKLEPYLVLKGMNAAIQEHND